MFEKKNVVVTGGAAGLGKTIAETYAKEGANVLIVDKNDPQETVAELRRHGTRVEGFVCDIKEEASVRGLGTCIRDDWNGEIDILVNNAGFNGKAQLVKDMQLDDWNLTLAINLTGTMLVIREVMSFMIARKSGNIVNIASNTGRRGIPYRADYACSKWAIIGLTQTLALELADHNIRVNSVCPGPIEGDRIEQVMEMHAESEGKTVAQVREEWENVPMKRFVLPGEVTSTVLFLSGTGSSGMTGQSLNVTGGFIMT